MIIQELAISSNNEQRTNCRCRPPTFPPLPANLHRAAQSTENGAVRFNVDLCKSPLPPLVCVCARARICMYERERERARADARARMRVWKREG